MERDPANTRSKAPPTDRRHGDGSLAPPHPSPQLLSAADTASPEAIARCAATCAGRGDWPAAEALWRRLLELRPEAAVALTGLGIALRETGRFPEALQTFRQAADRHPSMAAAHFNLGTCLLGSDRAREAIGAFRAALAIEPKYPEARFNLSLALLKSGSFKNGALAYETRWQAEWKGKERPFHGPRWNGRPLPPAQSLLLWGEQGIGDEIMFAGLVEAAIRTAAAPVSLECAPRLVPLFARSFPSVRVLARVAPPDPAIEVDMVHCPVGSLPGLLWPEQPLPPRPYLSPDPATVAQLRHQLASLGPGRKIGIAWRGGHPAANRPRFIPPSAWVPLLREPDLVPICVQHAPAPEELARFGADGGRALHLLPGVDPLVDMDAFAALVGALDGIVSVDNSTVHLAGALGVPTAVLLGAESDWRWGEGGVPCPWYCTVDRIRQTTPTDWSHPMQAASAFVRTLAPRP